ncbi:MAG: carbohydrate ABC transporter permease [Candidatus Rokubacteria bacterium]|nr:carbohydrate ABC transporter permease [Candidatus Rokubacteria bacterium]
MSASSADPGAPRQRPGRPRVRGADVVALGLLTVAALVMLMPLYLILLAALRPAELAFAYPPDLLPTSLTLANFPEALFRLLPFPLYFRNTAIIAVLGIVGDLLSCSLVAYGFARFRFPGRDILFVVLLSTLMVPLIVRLVPLFVLFQQLGWINTFLPLSELVDAARIDGASEIGIWWRIMLPLSKPVLAAVTIFAFQNTWNDFLGPLVFLQKNDVRTVILGLYGLMGMFADWHLVMAAVVATVLPMVVVFLAFQRFFVKGISVTGLKG